MEVGQGFHAKRLRFRHIDLSKLTLPPVVPEPSICRGQLGDVDAARELLKSGRPGVEKMGELGIARSDAIAVKGESYGGYSVLSLLMQTGRFKAAIAIAPVADLFDMYSIMNDAGESEWISWAEQSQGRMAGTPWQYRDKYVDNSPFFFADRIDTPVLIVQAAPDYSP